MQGELAHRQPKSWYGRTDKRDFKGQMTQIERRQARLLRLRSRIEASSASNSQLPSTSRSTPDAALSEGRRTEASSGSNQSPESQRGLDVAHEDSRLDASSASDPKPSKSQSKDTELEDDRVREPISPDRRYVVGRSQNEPLDLSLFATVPGYPHPDRYLVVSALNSPVSHPL